MSTVICYLIIGELTVILCGNPSAVARRRLPPSPHGSARTIGFVIGVALAVVLWPLIIGGALLRAARRS